MTTVRRVRRKRFAINGGRKVLTVTAERGRMKISWVSTESSLIRIRRTETIARLTRPAIPFLYDSLRIANKESEINRQENAPKGREVMRAKRMQPRGKEMQSRGERL